MGVAQRTEPAELVVRGAEALRREISARNLVLAGGREHEVTYGDVPSVIYCEGADGVHGNFFPASWRRIVANADWAERLEKTYTASRRVARGGERWRGELDCAVSSDALLMNVFCHPTALRETRLCALLGVEPGSRPEFGVRVRTPLVRGLEDRTEVDMRLGDLLVEAKLSEPDFGTAREDLMLRYVGFGDVFDGSRLERVRGLLRHYQLLRGVMAAAHGGGRFALLCDARRPDLREAWFAVMCAVRCVELRSRLVMVTWQEVAACLPKALHGFLAVKYGIEAV